MTLIKSFKRASTPCLAESEYARCLVDVVEWSKQNPKDWKKTWQLFEDKWANRDLCSQGVKNNFDIDAKTNGAYIAIGLLYGEGDLEKTINLSIMCGQDSDCNPASAAGVLGIVLGYDNLPEKWITEIEAIKDEKFSYTDYSFNDICQSTLNRAKKLVVQKGGSIDRDQIKIAIQQPVPAKLEQWKQDQPVAVIQEDQPAFSWQGDWQKKNGAMASNQTGAKATFTFEGTGALVLGSYNKDSGIADVYLDGAKKRSINLYYERSKGAESIYHVMGLPRGKHTITVVVTGNKQPGSEDCVIYVDKAIVLDGPEKK